MFKKALTYPTSDDEWPVKVGIGALLSLFSWLIIPGFLVLGYYVRILRSTTTGEDGLPEWDEWLELLGDGAKLFLVMFAYLLVPIGVGIVLGLLLGDVSGALATILTFAVGVVFYYALPAGMTNYATTGKLGAAFDADVVKRLLTSSDYAVGWLVAFAILVVGGIVVGVLSLIPILGWIAALLVSFLLYVAVMRVYGLVYRDVIGRLGA